MRRRQTYTGIKGKLRDCYLATQKSTDFPRDTHIEGEMLKSRRLTPLLREWEVECTVFSHGYRCTIQRERMSITMTIIPVVLDLSLRSVYIAC